MIVAVKSMPHARNRPRAVGAALALSIGLAAVACWAQSAPGDSKTLAIPPGPLTYDIDPMHTYPSFEADHRGLSFWRGKFKETSGKVVLDRGARTGTLEITVNIGSIDFGLDKMNAHALSNDMFDVAKYPTATYKGKFSRFDGDAPTEVQGDLTLHGVTKPLTLTINRFACKPALGPGNEICGADASASFDRAEFGINFGLPTGFSPLVRLAIQVEATRE